MTVVRFGEAYVRYLHEQPGWSDDLIEYLDEQPCPKCRGRAEDDCLTCGGEGYV